LSSAPPIAAIAGDATRFVRVILLLSALAFATLLPAPAEARKPPGAKFIPPVAHDSGPDPTSVAVADLRGAGKLGLVVANYCKTAGQDSCEGTGEVAVLLGNGDGTFQPPVAYSAGAYGATSVGVGDVNGDGVPDLVVADYCQDIGCKEEGTVSVLLGDGNGTFQPAAVYGSGGYRAYSVAAADLRGHGILDLIVTNTCLNAECTNGSVSVLVCNGNGVFQPAVSYDSGGYIAASVAAGDVNGDGIADLVVANFCEYNECGSRNGEVGVLLGNGDGSFQPAVLYDSGGEFFVSVAMGDLKGNGILDVVAANNFSDNEGTKLRSEVSVLLGNGDGTFQTAAGDLVDGVTYPSYPAIGWDVDSLAVTDVNGDGIPDLAVVESCQSIQHNTDCIGNKEVNVFLGNGDGTFQAPVVYSSGGFVGLALAIADLNGDGRPDLVVTNAGASSGDYNDGSITVLLNATSYSSKAAITSSPNPSQVNQAVTFTATIASTPPIPNGEVVTFYDGKTNLGTGTTTNGVASLTTSFAKAKTYTIKGDYPGDAFHKKSSATMKQAVDP
jgi:hypothetical protein